MIANNFSSFRQYLSEHDYNGKAMPVLFVGHGSPMNGIEDNEFSRRWKQMAKEIPVPVAVLVISAHWFTKGTKILAMPEPRTVHDFYGFPKALSDVQYNAPGKELLAKEIITQTQHTHIEADHDWGLDHGTWTIVRHMYPNADVPVLQLSIDYSKSAAEHYALAQELQQLRYKGVLIIGSGNMVHNLRMIDWSMIKGGGYDWAVDMNEQFKYLIADGNHHSLIEYQKIGKESLLAIPTPEHYLPLLYTLGAKKATDAVSFFNDKTIGGSLTMTTSVKIDTVIT